MPISNSPTLALFFPSAPRGTPPRRGEDQEKKEPEEDRDRRKEGERDRGAAKHVGFELGRSLRGARRRETDKNGDRTRQKPTSEMYKTILPSKTEQF